jgi:hypothetical protein
MLRVRGLLGHFAAEKAAEKTPASPQGESFEDTLGPLPGQSSEAGTSTRRANLGDTGRVNIDSPGAPGTPGTGRLRVRRLLAHFGAAMWCVVVVWVAFAFVVQTIRVLTGTTGEPREGDPCGPGHRLTWVGVGPFSDLSCEPE